MSTLGQFDGATLVGLNRVVAGRERHMVGVVMTFRLPDGSSRDLDFYTLSTDEIHVRIDGMYVPTDEL